MKIGYKGTDKDMKCRDFQYEIGKKYYVQDQIILENPIIIGGQAIENENLKLCSKDTIHYCNGLVDVFKHYKLNQSNRFFKIAVYGEFKDDYNDSMGKSGATCIEFLEEISQEELERVQKEQKENELDKAMGLPTLRELQKKFPLIQISGSVSLYLQGCRLKRFTNGMSDFDLIHPYYVDLYNEAQRDEEFDIHVDYDDEKTSGNDFDSTYILDGRKSDMRIDPFSKYEIIEHRGHKYRVNTIEDILAAKIKYTKEKGGEKHRQDIRELLGIKSCR